MCAPVKEGLSYTHSDHRDSSGIIVRKFFSLNDVSVSTPGMFSFSREELEWIEVTC